MVGLDERDGDCNEGGNGDASEASVEARIYVMRERVSSGWVKPIYTQKPDGGDGDRPGEFVGKR